MNSQLGNPWAGRGMLLPTRAVDEGGAAVRGDGTWHTVGTGCDTSQGRKQGAEGCAWWSSTGPAGRRLQVAEAFWDLQLGGPRKAEPLAGMGMVPENETVALVLGAE